MSIDIRSSARSLAQKLDRRMQTPPSQPKTRIAAQDDGLVISNDHRILNFTGPGVTVSDDPTMRRTNVYIPGAPASSSTTVALVSSTTAKIKTLGALGSYSSAPANWETAGFVEDGTWTAAVAATDTGGDVASIVGSGAAAIWKTANPTINQEKVLCRHTFTLPAGTITSATLLVLVDAYVDAVYLNGTFIGTDVTLSAGSSVGSRVSASITPSLLITGGSNILAIQGRDDAATGQNAFIGYKLLTTYTSTASGSGQMAAITGDVTLTSANTFYDGPSLSLTAGTWLLVGTVTVLDTSTFANFTARLWDGAGTPIATSETQTNAATVPGSIALAGIVSPAVTTTYRISVASDKATNGRIKATTPQNGTTNTASTLTAMRVV